MTAPHIYNEPLPADVLDRHPHEAYMEAVIYPQDEDDSCGVCLLMDIMQPDSDFGTVGVSPDIERYDSLDDAKAAALRCAREYEIPHLYFKVECPAVAA